MIHVIDGVLTIPPVVSGISQEAGLSAFLGAVNASNLTKAVNTTPNLTIFAPNNAAFRDISSALDGLTAEEIASILQYHVINGTLAYSSTLTNGSVPTIGGEDVTITITDGEVFVNRARVISADILISNGVLHVIDSVLSPSEKSAIDVAEDTDQPYVAFPGASAGSDIPYTSNIPSATSNNPALASTDVAVASGSPADSGAAGSGSAGSSEGSSTSAATGTMETGAIGVAALIGGAVILANM